MALNGPSGNSWPGLAFGIAGSLCIAFAGFLSARRKVPHWRLGPANWWLKGHLWLGLLSYPLILFHAGFHFGGTLTTVLMVLFTVVMVSGIFGIIVQQFVPGAMPLGRTLDQLEPVGRQLLDRADVEVAMVCGHDGLIEPEKVMVTPNLLRAKAQEGSSSLRRGYLEVVRPYLVEPSDPARRITRSTPSTSFFQRLRRNLPEKSEKVLAAIESLETICNERSGMMTQRRLHYWLHGWLLLHVPLWAAMGVISVVHAITALYY
jgi:hypothetical protein